MARCALIVFIIFLFADDNPRFSDRPFINYGRIDASIKSKNDVSNLFLVQIDHLIL